MLSIPKTYFFPHEIPYNKKSGIQPLLLQLANFQKVPIALRHCLTTAVPIIYIYLLYHICIAITRKRISDWTQKKDDTFVSSFFSERETGLEPATREFDSCIFKKHLAGRIKPAFFVSTFLFLGMLFYVIV